MRRSRGNYALWYFLITIIVACLNVFMERIDPDASAILLLAHMIICIFLAIGRFKDMNKSPWLSLLTIIPLVSFILIFPKGTDGENRYGPDPKSIKNQ